MLSEHIVKGGSGGPAPSSTPGFPQGQAVRGGLAGSLRYTPAHDAQRRGPTHPRGSLPSRLPPPALLFAFLPQICQEAFQDCPGASRLDRTAIGDRPSQPHGWQRVGGSPRSQTPAGDRQGSAEASVCIARRIRWLANPVCVARRFADLRGWEVVVCFQIFPGLLFFLSNSQSIITAPSCWKVSCWVALN